MILLYFGENERKRKGYVCSFNSPEAAPTSRYLGRLGRDNPCKLHCNDENLRNFNQIMSHELLTSLIADSNFVIGYLKVYYKNKKHHWE